MNYKFLASSFSFALASFAFFKFHKWWLNVRKEKKGAFYKPDTNLKAFQNWIIIIGFAITSIVYLFKAIR
jgi:hypothetical protein